MDRRIYDDPRRQIHRGARIEIDFEGERVPAYEEEPIAVALFASGVQVLSRSTKYHRPRAFFCLSGSCGSCLMRVDGLPNMKACRTLARAGCRCERQNAFPSANFDFFAAADWIFPHGMDHHRMGTSSRLVNEVMKRIVRQLGGLGQLPDGAPAVWPQTERRHVEVVVVGAGPGGLAAATAAAEGGAKVLLLEERDQPGGSLQAHPAFGLDEALVRTKAAREAGVEVMTGAAAVGLYPPDHYRREHTLAVVHGNSLYELTADRIVYACGAYEQSLLFEDHDRPGIMAARAVGLLTVRYGVRPADRAVLLGGGPYARALGEELLRLGVETRALDCIGERPVRAHGQGWVTGIDYVDLKGRVRRADCDLCAVAAMPQPASELPRQHGASVQLSEDAGGFAVTADRHGHTTSPHVYACGDVTGFMGVEQAQARGEVAGLSAALDLHDAPTLRRRRDQAADRLGA
ncbi:MAG TPA: 2Fe-2S iron-sulfur cluster-binding protein [Polyangia bacterium]|jgi:sarcosine oxidase subunit alpha